MLANLLMRPSSCCELLHSPYPCRTEQRTLGPSLLVLLDPEKTSKIVPKNENRAEKFSVWVGKSMCYRVHIEITLHVLEHPCYQLSIFQRGYRSFSLMDESNHSNQDKVRESRASAAAYSSKATWTLNTSRLEVSEEDSKLLRNVSW